MCDLPDAVRGRCSHHTDGGMCMCQQNMPCCMRRQKSRDIEVDLWRFEVGLTSNAERLGS